MDGFLSLSLFLFPRSGMASIVARPLRKTQHKLAALGQFKGGQV